MAERHQGGCSDTEADGRGAGKGYSPTQPKPSSKVECQRNLFYIYLIKFKVFIHN